MANNELILEFGLPGLNKIIKAAKIPTRQRGKRAILGMVYASMKKKYTEMVEMELYMQGCIPDEPFMEVDIEFIWTEAAHPRDPDNIRAGAKAISL